MFIHTFVILSPFDRNRCDLDGWHEASIVPREELLKGVVGKDALFCTLTDKIDAEVIERAGKNLKVIATMSVGYEHIDLAECKKRKIRVGYTPGASQFMIA